MTNIYIVHLRLTFFSQRIILNYLFIIDIKYLISLVFIITVVDINRSLLEINICSNSVRCI